MEDVVTPVRDTPGAKVRILSGRGSLTYYSDGSVALNDEVLHIGGTLIEWSIPVQIVDER